jgi:hypothetical protein
MKLTIEEQGFLKRMDTETLAFFVDIKDHKYWTKMISFYMMFNDVVKNSFFDENEMKFDEENVKARHAYARGQVNATGMIIRIIAGARDEQNRRAEEAKKRKEAKKE